MIRARVLLGTAAAVAVIGAIVAFGALFPGAAMGTAGFFRNLIRLFGPLLVGVAGGAAALWWASKTNTADETADETADDAYDGSGNVSGRRSALSYPNIGTHPRRRGRSDVPTWGWVTGAGIVTVALVVQVALWATYSHYAGSEAAGSLVITSELPESDRPELPSFTERRPYSQARTLIGRNRDDVPGELVDVTHVGDGQWTGLFSRPQGIVGVVEWDEAGTGPSHFSSCVFNDRPHSLDGSFWRNLRRDIQREFGWLRVDPVDAYGVCSTPEGSDADPTPVVYVPATRHEGFWAPRPTPAGVVIITDGGHMEWDADITAGEHPGPVYPLSVVQHQQVAAQEHSGSVTDSWFSRRLWYIEDSDTGEGSQAGNSGEFTLTGEDGRLYYVTPARRRKEGPQIRALIVTPADESTEGSYNTQTVHVLDDPRPAFSRVTEATEALLSTSGLVGAVSDVRVIEVTPAEAGGVWVGTVVRGGEPIFRVESSDDETVCLWAVTYGPPAENADPLACNDDPAVGSVDSPPPPTGVPAPGGDLADLTDSELARLLAGIAAELEARTAPATP